VAGGKVLTERSTPLAPVKLALVRYASGELGNNAYLTRTPAAPMSGGNAVAKMLFAQFDKDNSGSIDGEELKQGPLQRA